MPVKVGEAVLDLASICVWIAEVTPSRYPISVDEALPIDVVVGKVIVPVNVALASVANPEMEAPAGIVTVPVKVGSASGAFKAIDDVSEDDKEALLARDVAISPSVSSAAGAEFIKSPITVFT